MLPLFKTILAYASSVAFVSALEISIARWFDPSLFSIAVFLPVTASAFVLLLILVAMTSSAS